MTVVGVMMVRNEQDILPWTLRSLMNQLDHVIVADNMSTDGTRADLDALHQAQPEKLTVIDDLEEGYFQSRKMTSLARMAHREFGADWIVPADSDELWFSQYGRIKDVLEGLSDHIYVAIATLFNHVTADRDDQAIANPLERIAWCNRNPAPLHKVACRYDDDLAIMQGNHGVTYQGRNTAYVDGLLTIRHFPYRSPEQFAMKAIQGAKAYAATDLPETEGAHWRDYGRLAESQGIDALYGVYREWFHLKDIDVNQYVHDPASRYAAH